MYVMYTKLTNGSKVFLVVSKRWSFAFVVERLFLRTKKKKPARKSVIKDFANQVGSNEISTIDL